MRLSLTVAEPPLSIRTPASMPSLGPLIVKFSRVTALALMRTISGAPVKVAGAAISAAPSCRDTMVRLFFPTGTVTCSV